MRRCCCCLFALVFLTGGAVVLGLAVFLYFDHKDIFEDHVNSHMKLEKGAVAYDNWLYPNTTHQVNFHFFTIDNPKEILVGKRARLREIGPFVFQ